MSRFIFAARSAFFVLIGMSLALVSVKGEPATEIDRGGVEQETFLLINQYRKAHDLPPLRWDAAIAKSARAHSKDMATGQVDFGHEGFNDRVNRLKDVLIGLTSAGENVLKTDDPSEVASQAVAVWLKSPPHLHNIRGDFNCSGLGIWVGKDGVIYFTQIFIKLEPRAQPADVSPAPQVMSPYGLLAQPNPGK
jgi:uncharacterized protein YkwD